MQVTLFLEHVPLTDREEAYVRRKTLHLTRFAGRLQDESTFVRIEFRREARKTTHSRIECIVTIALPGKHVLRGEVFGTTATEAIDLVIAKLRKQVERYKTVFVLKRRQKKARASLRRAGTL